jgi:orotate phosphoribosyltransferase
MTFPLSLEHQIVEAALLRGSFLLRSGASSDVYFDKYRFESDPVLLREIASRLIGIMPEDFDLLAGLELGGVPIATVLSQLTGKPTRFVRKKAKDYGTCLLAEGGEVRGRRLLIVEDVVTSGGQVVESVRALRAEGAVVNHVICVIDREAGGRENLAREGLALHALFRSSELGQ